MSATNGQAVAGSRKSPNISMSDVMRMTPDQIREDMLSTIDKATTMRNKDTGAVTGVRPSYQLHVQAAELVSAYNVLVHGQKVEDLPNSVKSNARMVKAIVAFKDAIMQPKANEDTAGKPGRGVDMANRLPGAEGLVELTRTFGREEVPGPKEAYRSRALHLDVEKLKDVVRTMHDGNVTALQETYFNFKNVEWLSGGRNIAERKRREAARERTAAAKESGVAAEL
jgi:hypothetical protein